MSPAETSIAEREEASSHPKAELSLSHLRFAYGDREVLKGIDSSAVLQTSTTFSRVAAVFLLHVY